MDKTTITRIDDYTVEVTTTPPAPAPVVETKTLADLRGEIKQCDDNIASLTERVNEITG